MKRLILGAVIAGTLGTAGATQWEYATLSYYKATRIDNGKARYGIYWYSKDQQPSFVSGGEDTISEKTPRDFFKKVSGWQEMISLDSAIWDLSFYNSLGKMGWEIVNIRERNSKIISALGAAENMYEVDFLLKRSVQP